MSKIVENLIKDLRNKDFIDLDSHLITEFLEHYELNELINACAVNIEGEDGVIVLDKALSYEIYFVNVNSYEISKLFWTLDEKEALQKYNEFEECCRI